MSHERKNQDFLIMAEYRLLKFLTENPESFKDSRIHEGIFYHDQSRVLYQSICNLFKRGEKITFSSLFQEANALDFSINQSTVQYLFDLEDSDPDLQNILSILEKSYQKKVFTQKLHKMLKETSGFDEFDSEKILQELHELTTLVSTKILEKSPLKTLDQWIGEYVEELENRRDGKEYTFGDSHLDRYLTRKAAPGQFILLAGATGVGKSAYALSLVNGFINLGIPSIYISLEMDGISTMDRLIAQRLEIPIDDLYGHGPEMESVIQRVEKERQALKDNNLFYFVENPSLSLSQIRSIIKEFKQRANTNYAIVVCDLITMVKDFQDIGKNKTFANAIELGVNHLNSICKEENVCFLGVAQFNRNADSSRVFSLEEIELLRPQLNHVKNSHALAERSRVLVSIFRPYYYAQRYLPDADLSNMEDIIEVQILKQSQGSVGKIMKYLFDPKVMTIVPLEEVNEE